MFIPAIDNRNRLGMVLTGAFRSGIIEFFSIQAFLVPGKDLAGSVYDRNEVGEDPVVGQGLDDDLRPDAIDVTDGDANSWFFDLLVIVHDGRLGKLQ